MKARTRPKVAAIVGWKNSGKTTLVSRLVRELTERGRQVATVKHGHHAAAMDVAGSDTHRHREAGACSTMLVTDNGWSLNVARETLTLDGALARCPEADIVLVEGFKNAPAAKIECRRAEADGPPLWPQDRWVVAVAHDGSATSDRPQFELDDITGLADFIEALP